MTKLGRIGGIQIRAHYSFLFAFGALTSIIAFGYLPAITPAASGAERLGAAILLSFMLAGSIIAHEFGHAFIARRQGRGVSGITLYLFGGAAHIDTTGMKAGEEIAIAAAGPLSSLLLAMLFLAAGAAAIRTHPQAGIMLVNVGLANALLAFFNVLPGLPMDGGRVLRGILWKRSGNVIAATRRATAVGRIIAYMGVAFGVLLAVRGDIFDGLWGVALGWFLAGLAQSYYRATIMRIALEGLRARDLCARDLPALQTSDSLVAGASHFGGGARSRVLAVLFGERPAGLVMDVDVARGADLDHTATVADVMVRIADAPVLEADMDALALLDVMPAGSAAAAIVVADNGAAYVGIVRREDIARYVEMVEALGNSHAASDRSLRRLGGERPRAATQARQKT